MTQLDLHPSIKNTRAIVTSRWSGSAYRPIPVRTLTQYYADTSLDNDADTWTCDFGDPTGSLLPMLDRDNEVRIQLFGVGQEGLQYLISGIADEVDFEEGTWTLTGRDLSSLATDSTVRPLQFKHARAWAIVEEQAKFLGFQRVDLSKANIVKKKQYTDGSESYWDFWYRMYRNEKMWIWCEPDGLLKAAPLNYNGSPAYYLGDPRSNDSNAIAEKCIPVTNAVLTKTSQGRVYEVIVYGHTGDNGFNITANDPTIAKWIKRPRKVLLDTESHTKKGAEKMAWEEIFEGKVGSVEYRITIPDPGFVIRQNQIARLYLKQIGLFGNFFVVGSRIQAGPDGFVQEIRLRQIEYALTQRIPTAPTVSQAAPPSSAAATSLGAQVETTTGIPNGWGDYFVAAAKEFHGNMDFNLFLAILLAICNKETSFQNERENGGPGGDHIPWHPFQPTPDSGLGITVTLPGSTKNVTGETKDQWQQKFANEPGAYGITRQYGVGPMQLTTQGLKDQADDALKLGHRDQYAGGRWHPQWNIWIAAKSLHQLMQDYHAVRDIDAWRPVDAYHMGEGGEHENWATTGSISEYAASIKNMVYTDPGYLHMIQTARQQLAAQTKSGTQSNVASDQPGDNATGSPPGNVGPNTGPLGPVYDYKGHIIGTPGQGTHSFTDPPNNWQSDNAYDISCDFGTPVYAVIAGRVGNWGVLPGSGDPVDYSAEEMRGGDRFAGNRINILGNVFSGGVMKPQGVYYAHMSKINRAVITGSGAPVKAGDLIGWSGMANGVLHLHFACEAGDPKQFLPGVN